MTNEVFSENSLIAQLNKDVEKINKPELSNEKRALLLSKLLMDRSIKAEAIKMLEGITLKSQNPALWVNLGRLYQSVGSLDLAEKTYTKAIKLAKAAQEPEEKIIASAGLAEVLTSQGKKQQEAKSLFQEAKTELEALGFNSLVLNQTGFSCLGDCGTCKGRGNKDGEPFLIRTLGCICRTSTCGNY